MRLYDITRELTTAKLYPGTPPVELKRECSIAQGAEYNLCSIKSSLHAATHCDAPLHFIDGAADIASMPLICYIGRCYVLEATKGALTADFFREKLPCGAIRLLLKSGGDAYLSPEAAAYLAERGVVTVGTDALSVSHPDDEAAAHIPLMRAGIAVIETLDLSGIPEGFYTLFAPPVKIAGAEGAFCRAVLMEEE
jgi:arylformamidase